MAVAPVVKALALLTELVALTSAVLLATRGRAEAADHALFGHTGGLRFSQPLNCTIFDIIKNENRKKNN